MFPFLPLVSAAAVAMGVLNTHRRFFVPALAPAFFNVILVCGGLGMLALGWGREERLWQATTVWAVLIVVGGVAQVAIQLPGLRRVGWRGAPVPDLAFRDPALRTIARRMAPVVISLTGVNVMLVIVSALSSYDDHWPSWLNYAFRLVHLPIGIVGVALGTVLLAVGSTTAAEGREGALDDLVRRGLRLNWFLSLPAAVGLAVLGEPIVRMLFQRGRFGPDDVPGTAEALACYAVGVVFYAGIRAAAALFLARGDTRTPMFASLGGILVTIVLALALVGPLEHRGLALAVALGSTTNFALLRQWGRRRYGRGSAVEPAFLLRVGTAAALLGALGHGAARTWLVGDGAVASAWGHAARTLGVVGGLALLYFVATAALGVEEVGWLRRRLGRGGAHGRGP
jgi:putative peptidoglycan lipid II flippase